MRNLGLAKKALLLALCASLAVPAGGLGLAPLTAQASPQVIEGVGSGSGEASAQSETNTQNNTDESTKSTNTSNGAATPQAEQPGEGGDGTTGDDNQGGTTEELVTDAQKRSSKRVLISHYNIKKSLIKMA